MEDINSNKIFEQKCDDCGRVVETHDDKGNGVIHFCYAEYFEKGSISGSFDSKNAKIRLCAKCANQEREKVLWEKYQSIYFGGRGCGY